ncbi:uncharacterized protein LOC111060180 [Nilaparvata lugens]|uniref:uncharacterized protein LOC111060180 n=1 Tax=Nilaparvata lugens TaxID=108931 RepID=UPI00193DB122|nr:uncharacterized protein LOC111060180 [Nilaparvata lugens]
MGIYFQELIIFSAFAIVASEYRPPPGAIVLTNDYPYNIYDVEYSWVDIVTKLKNIKNAEINSILEQYTAIHQVKNIMITKFLRWMLIQHCISQSFMEKFEKEEKLEIKYAIKEGLQIGRKRIQTMDSQAEYEDQTTETNRENMESIFEDIETLLGVRNAEENMMERAEYVTRNYVMEYISLSLSETLIANFLMSLFLQIDQNDLHKEIITNPLTKNTEGKNESNLMSLFEGFNDEEIVNYRKKPLKNRKQLVFQNRLIRNHCIQKRVLKQASTGIADNVLKQSVLQKTNDFVSRLKLFELMVFNYQLIQTTREKIISPSLAGLRDDVAFTQIRVDYNCGYKHLTDDDINDLDFLLSEWILEKISMSVIADDEMYQALRQIFLLIDTDYKENNIVDLLKIDV